MSRHAARGCGVLTLVVLFAGAFAAPAGAHGGDPNYRSQVNAITPETPGIGAEILDYDADIQLTNRSGEDLTVFGYQDEPYVRIAADGTVQVNTNSPAHYLNEDRYAQVEVPPGADPKAPPAWKTIDKTGVFDWHDHRSHYMAEGVTPPQVTDKSARTKVFDYSIPIEIGARKGAIDGTLFWVGEEEGGGFPVAPFIGLGAVVLALAGVAGMRRRRGQPRGGDGKEAW